MIPTTRATTTMTRVALVLLASKYRSQRQSKTRPRSLLGHQPRPRPLKMNLTSSTTSAHTVKNKGQLPLLLFSPPPTPPRILPLARLRKHLSRLFNPPPPSTNQPRRLSPVLPSHLPSRGLLTRRQLVRLLNPPTTKARMRRKRRQQRRGRLLRTPRQQKLRLRRRLRRRQRRRLTLRQRRRPTLWQRRRPMPSRRQKLRRRQKTPRGRQTLRNGRRRNPRRKPWQMPW